MPPPCAGAYLLCAAAPLPKLAVQESQASGCTNTSGFRTKGVGRHARFPRKGAERHPLVLRCSGSSHLVAAKTEKNG